MQSQRRDYELAGWRPWDCQPHSTKGDQGEDSDSARYVKAIPELREALKDGRWHMRSLAVVIARRHRVSVSSLIDRAGCYTEHGRVIWPYAMK